MEIIRIGLLLIYATIRAIPFAIMAYFVINTEKRDKNQNSLLYKVKKVMLFLAGMCINVLIFIGMHYINYKNCEIIGYIKNIWGLNFYHHDVEYFIVSATLAIILSLIIGLFLRTLFEGRRIWNVTKGQQVVIITSGFAALLLLLLVFNVRGYYHSYVQINEICSNNNSYVLDENTLIEDYVELINVGMLPCQISRLYLSDDRYDLKKLSLEGMIIPAGDVLVIPCIEDVASFSINNKGEEIYLSDANGNILEQVTVGRMEEDTSYARLNDNKWEIRNCTPGVLNEIEKYQVEKPMFSHESGFYKEEFDLVITASENTTIYYTLDGSIPSEGSYVYEDAIYVYDKSLEKNAWRSLQNVVPEWKEYIPNEEPVDKAFLVRAIAVDGKGNKSQEEVATYFIDKDKYRDKMVISLIADPQALFGDENGIYVTGKLYDEWYLNGQEGEEPIPNFMMESQEREAVIELFDMSGSVLQQNVGVRIQGASAREGRNKRFSVFAREEYGGSELFDKILFERETKSHSLLIREGLADIVCQQLMENRNIPIQRAEPIHLFLDGEYWYNNRYMREKYSTQYFEDNYGITKDNFILFKAGSIEKGVETDQLFYDGLYKYVQEKDLSQEVEYEQFCEMIDIYNYIDYLVANIYCANMDVDDKKNVVMWRSREIIDDEYEDGKWRWALYDMDAVEWTSLDYYEIEEIAALDSFSQKPKYAACAYNEGTLYSALRQNEDFCKQFVLTFMDLLNTNFSIQSVNSVLNQYGQDITWLGSFFERRPAYMKQYLAKEFALEGSLEEVTIYNIEEQGTVLVNSINPKMYNDSWRGEYFTDYPITVTAVPMDGYEFVGWSGSIESKDATLEIPVEKGGIVLKAEFKKIR